MPHFPLFKDCFFVLHDCRTTGIFPGTGFVHSACLEKASDKIKYPGSKIYFLNNKEFCHLLSPTV